MRYTSVLFVAIFTHILFAQQSKFIPATIAFYNTENLYDTINSVDVTLADTNVIPGKMNIPKRELGKYTSLASSYDTRDEEFTPNGSSGWDYEKFQTKLQHLSEVISKIGKSETGQAPAVIGLVEIENRFVLEQLVQQEPLRPYDYGIVHFDGPDERGVDVAFLYQKKRFRVLETIPFELKIFEHNKRIYTRDQLLLYGLLDGEPLFFIVNHWPSRRGGQARSEPNRIAAAKLCRSIVDRILDTLHDAKIIIMGDFNDDPNNSSILNILATTSNSNDPHLLYNPFFALFEQGNGSLTFQDKWNLFDQIILSPALMNKDYHSYRFWRRGIMTSSFLLHRSGNYKNQPWRTFEFGKYTGGYSDHLPVYVTLIRNF